MPATLFEVSSSLPAPAADVVAWHARPGAFERLNPPWAPARVLERHGDIRTEGSTVRLSLPGPVGRVAWTAEHSDFDPERGFVDRQVTGPFARWEHRHQVTAEGAGSARLTDRIEFAMPLAALGGGLAAPFVRKQLERTFRYRHATTRADMELHRRLDLAPMTVAVTGASGLVGDALCSLLSTGGHKVLRLVRKPGTDDEGTAFWDPASGAIDASALEGVDAVVHLAGENIAAGRWTAARKRAILESREAGTRLLASTLAGLTQKPKVLVSASAIGWYGDRGDEILPEEAAPGEGFLADVCRAWEDATGPAEAAGIRTVNLRIGVVISAAGGALATMLPPFRAGVGGVLGPGSQYMSWIGLDDVLGAILHAIATPSLAGPVNATAPTPATNRELTKTLGRVLGRPTVAPVPAFAARLLFGEMGDALLLASTRVVPGKLLASGYEFRHPALEEALRHTLGRAAA